jgi:hypothetical protein
VVGNVHDANHLHHAAYEGCRRGCDNQTDQQRDHVDAPSVRRLASRTGAFDQLAELVAFCIR